MVQKQNLINLNWKPTQMVVEPKKKIEGKKEICSPLAPIAAKILWWRGSTPKIVADSGTMTTRMLIFSAPKNFNR
jgi:hypothetical protein